ncbi:MAG TPA: hypothetical protein PLY91_09295 [Methanoregulaceae archaeon]|jgi:ABC-type nitrate/sulfonate/bicarbonate transport system substrate-binding protein|nr:hypothetical protein [Methanoregulaceae archaeon]
MIRIRFFVFDRDVEAVFDEATFADHVVNAHRDPCGARYPYTFERVDDPVPPDDMAAVGKRMAEARKEALEQNVPIVVRVADLVEAHRADLAKAVAAKTAEIAEKRRGEKKSPRPVAPGNGAKKP